MQKFNYSLNLKKMKVVNENFLDSYNLQSTYWTAMCFKPAYLQKISIYKNLTRICLTKKMQKVAEVTSGNLGQRTSKFYWMGTDTTGKMSCIILCAEQCSNLFKNVCVYINMRKKEHLCYLF